MENFCRNFLQFKKFMISKTEKYQVKSSWMYTLTSMMLWTNEISNSEVYCIFLLSFATLPQETSVH